MIEKIHSVLPEIGLATAQTAYMLALTLVIALVFGGALGVWPYVVRPNSLAPKRSLYIVLDAVVNFVRSFPFLILLVSVIPFTRFVVGTAIGTTAVVVPHIHQRHTGIRAPRGTGATRPSGPALSMRDAHSAADDFRSSAMFCSSRPVRD